MLFKVERCVIGTVLSTTEPLQAYVSLMIAECILILVRSAVAGRQEMRLHFSNFPPPPSLSCLLTANSKSMSHIHGPDLSLRWCLRSAVTGFVDSWNRGFVNAGVTGVVRRTVVCENFFPTVFAGRYTVISPVVFVHECHFTGRFPS